MDPGLPNSPHQRFDRDGEGVGRGARWTAALLALAGLLGAKGWAADTNGYAEIHPPVGPYVFLQPADFAGATSFTPEDRVVLTPYFYWYDVYSGAHLKDADGSDALTDHPLTLTGFSYRSTAWHRQQLLDMMDAGIDVLLPVYWGEPSQRLTNQPVSAQPWSYAGLPPLVQARDDLVAEGRSPPRIGMFYDTSTLQWNAAGERIDLTTPRGREWFFESVRDFYSLIPPRHWAMIHDQPVVFLYSAAFAANHDQSCLDYLRTCFARDFGGRNPYVVREVSWQVRSEAVYAWGGALGLKCPGVASLGPGYDDSAVLGRTPLVVPREAGQFFRRNWEAFLVRPSKLVMIETWNEFHEGTDIAESREYGRDYLAMNRECVAQFKSGVRVLGPYSGAHQLSILMGPTNQETGLIQFDWADGVTVATNLGGLDCRLLETPPSMRRYLYLRADNSFKWADRMNLLAVVDVFDGAPGELRLQFDGSDESAPFEGAYTSSPEVFALSGSGTWRTAVFSLPDARLRNSQNGGADFRLDTGAAGIAIRRVRIVRPGLEAVGYAATGGFAFRLYGAPGAMFSIEASTNLSGWAELTGGVLTNTIHALTDTRAPWRPSGYYRARWR